MDKLQKIGKVEAIALILTIFITQIILNLPNSILLSTGTSACLNTIYIFIIALIFTLVICKLFKRFKSDDILDISEYLGGRILKIIIGILYIITFLIITISMLVYFSSSLKIIYFHTTPLAFILLFFLIPAIIANRLGFKVISRVNLIFMPILLLSILVVLSSTFKEFVFERMFPIFGYGTKETFLLGLSNIFAFNGLGYLYFLNPLLKNSNDFKKISIISIVLSTIHLFISVLCLLMVFSFITSSDEMLSMYLITRMMEYGRFFQRTDAIFIFIWILAMLSYISISFFFVLHIFKKITKISNSRQMVYCLATVVFGLCLLFPNIDAIKFMERNIFKYFVLALIFVISLIIIILANLKKRKQENLT